MKASSAASSSSTSIASLKKNAAQIPPIAGAEKMRPLASGPCRLWILRRFLVLLCLSLIVSLLIYSYQTRGDSSYLDLVLDSLIPDLGESSSDDPTVSSSLSELTKSPIVLCRDMDGWVSQWLASGSMPKCSLADQAKVDVLYTWVNGSEPLYQKEKHHWQDKSPVFGGKGITHDRKIRVTERRHREHDELRYSVRSVFKYFHNSFNSIRILASDFASGNTWQGQIPYWLDLEAAKRYNVSMLYTSELYGDQKSDLPVFNSLALESQFRNVPKSDPNIDVMVYLNDDMFLASPHSVTDFWNPIVGMNFQVDHHSWVENEDASVMEFQHDWNSEWTALRYTNFLLSRRFGFRRRPYVAHFGKALSRSLLSEIQNDFQQELTDTSKNRFRAEGKDVNTVFMHSHYIMERHREVLLESYLVHRADANGDGGLDIEERHVVIDQINSALRNKFVRHSLEEQVKAMRRSGLPMPIVSKPIWVSTDGYPFALKQPASDDQFRRGTQNAPQTYSHYDAPHNRKPSFDFIEHCLTSDFVSEHHADVKVHAKMLFKIISKEYPYCGDMLLSILIPSSNSGLHHLLPAPSHPQYANISEQLHRYAYTISETTSEFIMARNAETLKKGFVRILKLLKLKPVAQFCVNDDVEAAEGATVTRMDQTFKGILQGYYGGLTIDRGKSPIERPETVEEMNSKGREFWGPGSIRLGGPGYDLDAVVITKAKRRR